MRTKRIFIQFSKGEENFHGNKEKGRCKEESRSEEKGRCKEESRSEEKGRRKEKVGLWMKQAERQV